MTGPFGTSFAPSTSKNRRTPFTKTCMTHSPSLLLAARMMFATLPMRVEFRHGLSLHPLEPHALAICQPCGDVAAGETGFALRHLLLRAAQRLPPRRAMRRARQRRVDDLLDLFKAQHEFGQLLPFQIIAQRVVIVHGRS